MKFVEDVVVEDVVVEDVVVEDVVVEDVVVEDVVVEDVVVEDVVVEDVVVEDVVVTIILRPTSWWLFKLRKFCSLSKYGSAPIPVGTSVVIGITSSLNQAISIKAINIGKSLFILNCLFTLFVAVITSLLEFKTISANSSFFS